MVERRLIAIEGVVQGVGFRPYVHRLATAKKLRGFVRNDTAGVFIDVEGERAHIDDFYSALTREPPAQATIARAHVAVAEPQAYSAFHIVESGHTSRSDVVPFVAPDVATCDACLVELFDVHNRRYGYPFITCAECGPRFTIVRDAPYDRERTTMGAFAMCAACRREYEDPNDRRFHAETIACPSCGPTLRARRSATAPALDNVAALASAVAALRAGEIVALKALGGYHLACDATSALAVERLRARKHRPAKPFAIMVRDLTSAEGLGRVSEDERLLLQSVARPIVLLTRREDADVAAAVAPAQTTLGAMLPSTPLHHLLADALERPLVMTSGNRSDEPVAMSDEDAFESLRDVADLFLTHDRPIAARCDDSVVRHVAGDARMVRRSRGFVPNVIALRRASKEAVLAVGGHLKNTICVARGAQAFLSAHVGDLESPAARAAWRDAIAIASRAAGVTPTVIAHDLHPDYASTHAGVALASELGIERHVPVQHHHAHVAACVAEHGVADPVIGVVFDGAGLGSDGAIWGGEFLLVAGCAFQRCGHLSYVPLPGGDAAARRPWRSAAAHLTSALPDDERNAAFRRPACVTGEEWSIAHQLLGSTRQATVTSSVGRLFDAVASLLGVCHVSRFEGEGAMALESIADARTARSYPVSLSDATCWSVNIGRIIRGVVEDKKQGRRIEEIAGAFHLTLRDMVVAGCERIRAETGVAVVALTGGVFMNALLLTATEAALISHGFRVLIPRQVPCNDGGLSLGQAYVAALALEEGVCV